MAEDGSAASSVAVAAETARQRRRLIVLNVERLPRGYGRPQCLVSRNDLRTLFDKACDMAMADVVGDAGEEGAGAHVSSASAAAEHATYQGRLPAF